MDFPNGGLFMTAWKHNCTKNRWRLCCGNSATLVCGIETGGYLRAFYLPERSGLVLFIYFEKSWVVYQLDSKLFLKNNTNVLLPPFQMASGCFVAGVCGRRARMCSYLVYMMPQRPPSPLFSEAILLRRPCRGLAEGT